MRVFALNLTQFVLAVVRLVGHRVEVEARNHGLHLRGLLLSLARMHRPLQRPDNGVALVLHCGLDPLESLSFFIAGALRVLIRRRLSLVAQVVHLDVFGLGRLIERTVPAPGLVVAAEDAVV